MVLSSAITKVPDIAKAGFYLFAGFIVWKAYQGLTISGDAAGSWLGDKLAPFLVPDVVGAQIRLQSRYFMANGDLTQEAWRVISTGYPNFYRVAFEGRRIRPDYSYLVDSGQPIIDADYKL